MRITRHKIRLTLATLLASTTFILTGCYEEQIVPLALTEEESEGIIEGELYPSYITLNITAAATGGSTRANPTGGELGDGTEMGQSYENAVNSAVLFLYQGDNVNINANLAEYTPVTIVEFNNFTEKSDERPYDYIAVSEPQRVDVQLGTYKVLAIANPKDLTWAEEKGSELTLADVRDHIESTAWAEGNGSYSSFLMSSENDEKGSTLEITEESTYDNPASTFVEVERMAARIDYQTTGTYTIVDDGTGSNSAYDGATVEITGAAIVNNLTAGSYLLKRTNNGLGTAVTYLGDEEDTNGVATNYVVDPWTEEKTGGDYVTIDGVSSSVSSLYGVYYPGEATSDEQDPSYWAGIMKKGTEITADGETWNRIGYTMENTTYADYTSKKYSTAVVFGATFTPAEGTVVDTFYDGFSYTDGKTFFKWNYILYATAEDMMATAYPSSSTATTPAFVAGDMFGAATFGSITSLEELQAFAATLRDDDPTGYKAYLESFEEFPTSKNTLYWETYMENECGYKFDTTNGVTLNAFDIETTYKSTRAALADYTDGAVSTYEDAQCYYTWWVRHSNDGDNDANGTMEYSIVRNNIYKLQVTSVYSIGGDIPEEGLRIHVYVKDWTMYDTEVINL